MGFKRSTALPLLAQYLGAAAAIAATTGLLWLVRDSLTGPLIALLYLLPVVFSATLWGLGPGIIAALGAFVVFNFFFTEPYFTLAVYQTQDVIELVVFLIVAMVISQLLGQSKAGIAAATAREREATRLYELSTALAGLHHEREIAHIIARHTHETFQPARVDLSVEGKSNGGRVDVRMPQDAPDAGGPPATTLPLLTARGTQGEIRLWRDAPLSSSEERLLRTYASQGALALERARLSQAETRAQVLEESDRLKSALLSSVSHELRTPLATIKASVSSLRGGDVPWDTSARAELLAAIEDETDHLNRLVGNLLDMSRIESGALKPQRAWNDLSEIVGGVVARKQPSAARHRIKIEIPDDLPLLPIDYMQIEQVFTNLIDNSIKYSPDNTTIRITACLDGDQSVWVRVINQGPPVPEADLERIFDKFYRVTAADRVTGTGLGLSICKGIVEEHGGRIWAENLPAGFAFNFTLPLAWAGVPPPHVPDESGPHE